MLFSRKAVGIEITQHTVRMALIDGTTTAPRLLAHASGAFPEATIRILHREPNVTTPGVFVNCLRETFSALGTRSELVSLSLPDSAGRVVLLDLDTRFKNRREGIDIIRWKLKKSLPFDLHDIHLDYQIIREKENGELTALVALMSRQVISQYEELLVEAGLKPNRVDFSTFNLYRLFAKRLEMSEHSLFVAFHDGVLSILVFRDGSIDFYRTKEVSDVEPDMNRIFMETNSSLLFYRDKNPGRELRDAFCLVPDGMGEAFQTVVNEACGLDPLLLDVQKFVTVAQPVGTGKSTLVGLAAALGAATRNLAWI